MEGKIVVMKKERGYAFVETPKRETYFTHVSKFQSAEAFAQSCVGDLVSFETGKDSKGRLCAFEVVVAGQNLTEEGNKNEQPKSV